VLELYQTIIQVFIKYEEIIIKTACSVIANGFNAADTHVQSS